MPLQATCLRRTDRHLAASGDVPTRFNSRWGHSKSRGISREIPISLLLVATLLPLVPTPALDGKPNIILLHIGTSDSSSQSYAYMAGIWYAAIKDLLSR